MQTFHPNGPAEAYSFFDPLSGSRMVALFQASLRDLEGHGINGFEFLDQTGLDADEIFPLARINLASGGPRNAVIFSQGGLITIEITGPRQKRITATATEWHELGSLAIRKNVIIADDRIELFSFFSINKLCKEARSIFSITNSVESFEQLLNKADLEEEAQHQSHLVSVEHRCAELLNDLARSRSVT